VADPGEVSRDEVVEILAGSLPALVGVPE
jgi:hypothetical protein